MIARILCLAVSVLLAGAALARADSRAMSCAQAAGLVHSQGVVVLSTGEHTYDRFVASGDFCLPGEAALRAYVPTADASKCPAGFLCRLPLFDMQDR